MRFIDALSDGSAPDVSEDVTIFAGRSPKLVRILFDAASEGQTLTVQWIMTQDFSGSKTPRISLESAVVKAAEP